MNNYLVAANFGVVLFLISCVGSFASAQPMTPSSNTSGSGSTNTAESTNLQCLTTVGCSTNMTISQVKQALSCPTGLVCLGPIQIQPFPSPLPIPGDAIGLTAVVINKSSKTISYNDICQSPLTAIFDRHVTVEHTAACFTIGTFSIPPGGNATVRGPPSGIVYRANSPALPAYGLATFTYHTDSITGKVYRGFSFDIFP
jgi:hypothetical protein